MDNNAGTEALLHEAIRENLKKIKGNIEKACREGGHHKNPDDVTIVGVTKTFGAGTVKAAIAAGIENIGENKVQELEEKQAAIGRACKWHMIGHLQKNKAARIAGRVSLIHSIDSIELLTELERASKKSGAITDVLVQINMTDEITKSGIKPGEVRAFLIQAGRFEWVKVKGLMTIAQYTVVPEETRPVFRNLHKIFIDMGNEKLDNINMEILSMGMSNDYMIAVEEGSNMVRIGTAIFGSR